MKKLTAKEFFEKAYQTHNNKYDYSLVNYTTGRKKIKILCPLHGEFLQIASNHLNGQ